MNTPSDTFIPWNVTAARVLLVCVLPAFLSYHLGRKIERWEHPSTPTAARTEPTVTVLPAVDGNKTARHPLPAIPAENGTVLQQVPVSESFSAPIAPDLIKDHSIWSTAPSEVILVSFTPETVSFTVSGGYITLHCDTGKVDIPKGLKIDEAARQFWIAVEKAFPRKPKP